MRPDTESRLIALEQQQADFTALIELKPDIVEIVELLRQMKAAFKVFIAAGRVMKWIAGLVATPIVIWYLLKKGDFSGIAALFRGDS